MIATVATAPHPVLEDIAESITSVFQAMWLSRFDFFRRVPYAFNTVAGTDSYTLPQSMQEKLEPVLLNGSIPLHPIATVAEFTTWPLRYLGVTVPTNARPQACFVKSNFRDGEDDVTALLKLTPTPDAVYAISMDLTYECPHYVREDLCADPSPELPLPHAYAESLFLPLARAELMKSAYFRDKDKIPGLQESATNARLRLGLADPANGTHTNKPSTALTAPAPIQPS